MKTLKELQNIITKEVEKLTFPAHPRELYEPIAYILSIGGKRMRPALLLMACDLFTDNLVHALKPALAIELFHNFTLMHDDIMDKAPLRRGKTTVHAQWNESIAILSGDAMFVESYKLMMQTVPAVMAQVLDIFNQTATGVCEGQQIDMNFEQRSDVSIEEYIEMIRLKTAVLLGGALKIGAIIGGAAESDAALLYDFGVQLGIAFQLQDDILDVYGSPEKFGKQVGGDIISNKKTFLLIKALELATGPDANQLEQWLNRTDFDPAQKVDGVKAIYDQLNIRQHATRAMQSYTEQAFNALNALSLPQNRKQPLFTLACDLLIREF